MLACATALLSVSGTGFVARESTEQSETGGFATGPVIKDFAATTVVLLLFVDAIDWKKLNI